MDRIPPTATMPQQQPNRTGARLRLIARIVAGVAIAVLVVFIVLRAADRGQFSFLAAAPAPTKTTLADVPTTSATVPTTPTPTESSTLGPLPVPPPGGGGGGAGGGGGGGGPATSAPPAGPSVNSFYPSAYTVACPSTTATFQPDQYVTLNWATSGASFAYIGVDTDDASLNPYLTVEPSGSYEIYYPCPRLSVMFTVTVVDDAGNAASESVIVTNSGSV